MRGLAWLSILVPILAATGCRLYDLPSNPPDTPPGRDQVFEAARAVIHEHYPMSVPVEKSNLILARTPVKLMGGAKTYRTVSVYLQRNRTGAWEPRVRVVLYQEVAEPGPAVEHTTESPYGGQPIGIEKWQPLQNLPLEEQRLSEEILAKIQI